MTKQYDKGWDDGFKAGLITIAVIAFIILMFWVTFSTVEEMREGKMEACEAQNGEYYWSACYVTKTDGTLCQYKYQSELEGKYPNTRTIYKLVSCNC